MLEQYAQRIHDRRAIDRHHSVAHQKRIQHAIARNNDLGAEIQRGMARGDKSLFNGFGHRVALLQIKQANCRGHGHHASQPLCQAVLERQVFREHFLEIGQRNHRELSAQGARGQHAGFGQADHRDIDQRSCLG